MAKKAGSQRRKRTVSTTATPDHTVARVSMWGKPVGAVSEDRTGRIVFEYEESFRSSGLEISPLRLPLATRGPVEFPELRRTVAFAGLPGVLADALPDAFGNAVIRRYFEERGTPDAALSPVQKLLYIGSRAMGALEFSPPIDRALNWATDEAIVIARLVAEARRVIEGDTSYAVPEMMQVGASAGGARAKALVLWNPATDRLKSAFAPRASGDEHWLVKFDGVTAGTGGPTLREDVRPGPFGRIEYVYSQLAAAAGVEMAATRLLRDGDLAHFMTKRFDRAGDDRFHMHTLGGLHHVDYNVRGVFSYEELFRTIRELELGQAAVDQAFRRMVFNIAAVNQDDHVKNFAFLMGPSGEWALAPAFDVTFAHGNVWTRTHQMTLGGKDDDFTRDDLLRVGAMMDVARDGAEILNEVESALGLWEPEAVDAGIPRRWIREISGLFRHFA